MKPWLAGLALAAVTVGAGETLPAQHALELLAAILVGTAFFYPGVALPQSDRRALVLETAVAAIFLLVALGGLWLSAWALVVGYLGRGLWDLLHHPPRVGTRAGAWFPPFCLLYDVLVAIYIGIRHV